MYFFLGYISIYTTNCFSLLIFLRLILYIHGEEIPGCNCSCTSKKARLFSTSADLHIRNQVVFDLKEQKLSLITGVPYFLLNDLPINDARSFYGTSSPTLNYWTNNADVNNTHMQWDILPTEYFGYYQLRKARDARFITCWKNKALVTLGDGRLDPENTFLSIEESPKNKTNYILRCKVTPTFAIKIDLTNEEFGSRRVDANFFWQFQPAYTYSDYYVHFSISNFQYATPPNNILSQRQKQVGLISETTIDNPTESTIEDIISRSEKKIHKYELVINKSYKKGRSSLQFGSNVIRRSSTDTSSITMADTQRNTQSFSTSQTDATWSKTGGSTSDGSSSSNTQTNADSVTTFQGNSERTQSDHTFNANLNAGISAKLSLLGRGVGAKADIGLGYKYYHSNIKETQDSTTKNHQTSDVASNSQGYVKTSDWEKGTSNSKTKTNTDSTTHESMRSQTRGSSITKENEESSGGSSGSVDEEGEDNGVIWEKSEEVTYTLERKIIVPPNSGVVISSWVDWVDGLTLPYKANVYVTVQGMKSLRQFTNCGKVNEDGFDIKLCENNAQNGFFDADGVEWFLRQFDDSLVQDPYVKSDMAVVLQTTGMFTGSYGLSIVYSSRNIKPINTNQNECNGDKKR